MKGWGLGAAQRDQRASRLRDRLGLDPTRATGWRDAALATARLEQVGPLPRLALWGSPYARGFAHGVLLGPQVRAQVTGLLGRVARGAPEHAGQYLAQQAGLDDRGPLAALAARGLDLPVLRGLARDRLLDAADARLAAHTPAHHLDEMLGLADGAGLDPRLVRRFHALAEVASAGCSNLAAWGQATRGGQYLQMRNLDWALELGVQDFPLLLAHLPGPDRRGHVTAGFVGFVGALQGLNDAGITLGEVGAGSRRVSYDGEPMVFRLRRVLEAAETLDAAGEALLATPQTKGYGFVLGSLREGRARAFEVNAERTVGFEPDDPREHQDPYAFPFADAVLRGDYAVDPAIRAAQRAADGPGDPRCAHSYRVRYQGVAAGLQARYGALDRDGLLAIARAAGRPSRNLVLILYLADRLEVAYAQGARRACDREVTAVPHAGCPVLAGLAPG